MFLSRIPLLFLTFSLLGGVASAQDEEEKLDEYVESEVEKENEKDGEAVGADPGEASYNVANCAPSEGAESGSDENAAKVDPDPIEGCEEMVK